MRTLYLEVTETQPGRALALQKSTVTDDAVRVVFPPGCKSTMRRHPGYPPLRTYKLQCSRGLSGQRIGFKGLGTTITEAVLRVQFANGRSHSALCTTRHPSSQLPQASQESGSFGGYVRLRFGHVLGGFDHLLFLLALLLLVHRSGALFLTITAFTFSHSLTLGLTAMGWLRLSGHVADACIAWSLVLGAWEATRREQLPNPDRLGTAMGLLFGLVHGLGFAGTLLSIGLPRAEIPLRLLAFNIGVEFGQLAFVLPGFALLSQLRTRPYHRPVEQVCAYFVGVPGAFWLWQRLATLWYARSTIPTTW